MKKLPGLTPTAPPPPQTGRHSVERDRPNNPLKRSSQPQEGHPHEEEITPPRGGVSGEEAPLKRKWVPMDGWVFQVLSDRGSIEGDELPVHKIPLLGCLYGSTQGVSGEFELFNKNIKRLNQIENEYKGRMKAREDAESFRKQEPLVDQIGLGNQAEATVSKLRRQRREEQLRADPGWQERVKGIDQQIEGVMREVNRGVGK